MAADSAVTMINNVTGAIYARPNSAIKLQIIPYLNAGISCWGQGTIAGLSTDQWLSNFISVNSRRRQLGAFARELERQLNSQAVPNANGSLGFHLAGFENYQGNLTPSFYHIHDGPSTTLAGRNIPVVPNRFNANHDLSPSLVLQSVKNQNLITRNGDYQIYAQIFDLLDNFFLQLIPSGIIIPHSQNLHDRADYLVFQIRTVSEIYRLSNLVPGIGGGIHYLTINVNGIHSQGIKYY